MIEVATANINSFAPKSQQSGFASPVEPSITISISQLKNIIGQAVKEAIEPLRQRIEDLEANVAQLQKELDNLSENSFIQLQLISDLREEVHKEPVIADRTKSHVDELHRLMIEEKTQQVSILKASRLLGISKERMRQLKPLILADGRFEMGWSMVKGKKAVVIRIRKYL